MNINLNNNKDYVKGSNISSEILAELTELRALKSKLIEKNNKELTLRVSQKGAISIYGLGKWPITMYISQANKVINLCKSGVLEKFISDNKHLLANKDLV